MRKDARHDVARLEYVGIAEHQNCACTGARDQNGVRLQRDGAGALGADQRARNVEAVLRQELVEIVTGDSAPDVREPRADFVDIAIS